MTPLSLTLSPMGRGDNSNRQALQRARREHHSDRPGSVAVLGLLFWGHLPKRPPHLRDQEHRVVPESRDTPPLGDDLASTFTLEKRRRPPRRRQRDASRVDAWVPLQHLDLDA